MEPRERDSEPCSSSSWGLEPRGPGGAHLAVQIVQQPGVLFNFCGCSASLPGPGGAELLGNAPRVHRGACRGCAPKGAEAAHGPTPTRQAGGRPPRTAPPCPSHPAAGGQCRYEEKDLIVPSTNRHTPDLCYCAPSIEMQTSRVRRPQSAPAPSAPQ